MIWDPGDHQHGLVFFIPRALLCILLVVSSVKTVRACVREKQRERERERERGGGREGGYNHEVQAKSTLKTRAKKKGQQL
jgi:hypothetical protein